MERTVCPDWERWGRLHRNEFSFICSFNSLHCATVPESVMDAETTMVNQTTNKPVQSSVIRTMRGIVKGAMGVKRNDIKSSLGSLGRKVTTNLDSILKSKDITWPTKVLIVKAMVFLVVMYGCESWTIKKAAAAAAAAKSLQSCLTLWPHGLQHTRLPCLSPTPKVYSNSCPLSRWCHSAISPSVFPLFSHLQSFPASESFPMSQLFTSGGQSTGISASAPALPMNIQDWFPLGLTSWISLLSKGLSRVFSKTTVQKHQFFGSQVSL